MVRARVLGGSHWQQGLVGCGVVRRHVGWEAVGESWAGGSSGSWDGSSGPAGSSLPEWGRLGLAGQRSNNWAHWWVLWVDVFADKVDSNLANFVTNPVTLLNSVNKVNSSPQPG